MIAKSCKFSHKAAMLTSRESKPNFELRGGRVRERQPRIGGQSRHGQIVEFTPLGPGRYYLARITDAGSVPCSTTNKTCKDTLFACRSTPSGPKPGGVFHFGLRTSPPVATPGFGTFDPFSLSFSAPCGRTNGQVRKDDSFKINRLRMHVTSNIFSNIGRHRKNNERKNPVKFAQQAVFYPNAPWRQYRRCAGAAPASTAACRWLSHPGRLHKLETLSPLHGQGCVARVNRVLATEFGSEAMLMALHKNARTTSVHARMS